MAGPELEYLRQAIDNVHVSGAGPFSARCSAWLERETGSRARAAHAFVHGGSRDGGDPRRHRARRRGDHALVHVRLDRERRRAARRRAGLRRRARRHAEPRRAPVEAALTPRTRAMLADPLRRRGLRDGRDRRASRARTTCSCSRTLRRASYASYRGRPLGGIGDARRASFHETKNVMCGEGGALLVNDERWVERAEIVHEKGTDRRKFFRGAGRQVQLGRHRLVVPAQRHQRRLPLGAARGRAPRSCAALGDLERLPRGV